VLVLVLVLVRVLVLVVVREAVAFVLIIPPRHFGRGVSRCGLPVRLEQRGRCCVAQRPEARGRWLETSKIRASAEVSGHGWPSSQNREVRRHSSPNILAFLASHRIWVPTQVVMTSPPSSGSPELLRW
jgi:hypothetical protein